MLCLNFELVNDTIVIQLCFVVVVVVVVVVVCVCVLFCGGSGGVI